MNQHLPSLQAAALAAAIALAAPAAAKDVMKAKTVGADTHPNHHLVVHVYDRKTGQAVTDAKVSLSFEPLGHGNKSAGASVEVPVVNMQAIGQGPKSTHYGNNVVMPAGSYRVTATINGEETVFRVAASDAPGAAESMGGMKMH